MAAGSATWGAVLVLAGPAAAEPPAPPGVNPPGMGAATDWTVDSRITAGSGIGRGMPEGPFGTAAPTPQGRGWEVTPSLGVQGVATDNVRNSRTRVESDVYTNIVPGIAASADTDHLRGQFNYHPTIRLNAQASDQNRLDHRFNGSGLVTVLPELLFLDVRAFGSVRPVSSSLGAATTVLDRQSAVQSTSFQLSPYLFHRFGTLATAQVGYSFRHTATSGPSATLPGGTLPFFTGQDLIAHEGYAVLRSGEDWGRFGIDARTVNTVFDGSGVYRDAHRYLHALQARYAVTRDVAFLLESGYEDQRYGGLRPLVIQEPIWSVGLRLTPEPGSVVVLRYGRRDGFESLAVNAGVDLGPRTRLFASYGERLGNSASQAADLLSTVGVDPLGNLVDTVTGAPTFTTFGNALATLQSSLLRIRTATASVVQTWPRDSITLTLRRDRRDPVAVAQGGSALSQTIYGAYLTWTHELAPNLTLTGAVQYGHSESSGAASGSSYGAYTTLMRHITATLTGTLRYSVASQISELQSGRTTQNALLVGLQQVF